MFGVVATLATPETLEKLAQQAPAEAHFVVESQTRKLAISGFFVTVTTTAAAFGQSSNG